MTSSQPIDVSVDNLEEVQSSASVQDVQRSSDNINSETILSQTPTTPQPVSPRTRVRLVKFLSSSSLKKKVFKPVHCRYCPRWDIFISISTLLPTTCYSENNDLLASHYSAPGQLNMTSTHFIGTNIQDHKSRNILRNLTLD